MNSVTTPALLTLILTIIATALLISGWLRPDIVMLVAEKYQNYAITRWMANLVDGIFIDRFNPDVRALHEAMKRLQRSGVLAIAPEGTRSKSGALIQAHPGGIYLAWKASLPILPVGITGTNDAIVMNNLKHLRKTRIKMNAGAVSRGVCGACEVERVNSRQQMSL